MVLSSAALPGPPVDFDLKLTGSASGTRLYRVHPAHFQGGEFNPNREATRRGRFHPFTDAQGQAVPTLYAADAIDGALSETVFHNVPGSGGRILRSRLRDLELSCLINRIVSLMVIQTLVAADAGGAPHPSATKKTHRGAPRPRIYFRICPFHQIANCSWWICADTVCAGWG